MNRPSKPATPTAAAIPLLCLWLLSCAGTNDRSEPVPTATAPSPQWANRAAVEAFRTAVKDGTIQPETLTIWARAGGGRLQTLVALVDEDDFRWRAIQALGEARDPRMMPAIRDKLRKYWLNDRQHIAEAAMISSAKTEGDTAAEDLRGVITQNYGKPGKLHLCHAAAKALGEIGTERSVRALLAELERVNEPTWLPDFGSTVIQALLTDKTQQGIQAARKEPADLSKAELIPGSLRDYARQLRARIPGIINASGRRYIQEKAEEAEHAATVCAEAVSGPGTGMRDGPPDPIH